jgi:hypothetical protein
MTHHSDWVGLERQDSIVNAITIPPAPHDTIADGTARRNNAEITFKTQDPSATRQFLY